MKIFKLGFFVLLASTSVTLAMKEEEEWPYPWPKRPELLFPKELNSKIEKDDIILPPGWTKGMNLQEREKEGFYYKFSSIKVDGKEIEKNHILSKSTIKVINLYGHDRWGITLPYKETKFNRTSSTSLFHPVPQLAWRLKNDHFKMNYKSRPYIISFVLDKETGKIQKMDEGRQNIRDGAIISITVNLMDDWFKHKNPPINWELTPYN